MNPWLGARRGHLSDWTTQQWVRTTGRGVDLREEAWLDGPWAPTTGIGERFFEELGLEPARADGERWSRTVAAMTEHLHVYLEGSDLHADHALRLWGRPFLRLHHAMQHV